MPTDHRQRLFSTREEEANTPVTPAQVRAVLRRDFPSFVQKCFHTLDPGTEYLPNWHIQAIAYHLDLIRRGKIRRLIINAPPRSLKSMLCSVALPTFMLGHDPTKRFICVSYAHELAGKHSNDCRRIMDAAWYKELFPGTRIAKLKNTESEFATTQNGGRLATSIDGTLTGRGGDVIIVDDPLKPSDAYSEPKRNRANEWFGTTLLSRLDNKQTGAIIVVMQRLHMDDLTGYLLRSSDEWTVLNFPAIALADERIAVGDERYHVRHEGDVLHAARESPLLLNGYRQQMGSDAFQAQFLQEPVPPGGNMVKRSWIKWYDASPERDWTTHVIQSWDTASKEGGANDFSVCTTWQCANGKYHLVDVFRDRLNYPALKAKATELAKRFDPTEILIEDTGVGIGLVLELQDMGLSAIAVKPEGNKVARMSVQSAKFEAGLVHFPREAHWLPALEAELFSFPGSRHDDQIDSISQALSRNLNDGYDTTMRWVTGY